MIKKSLLLLAALWMFCSLSSGASPIDEQTARTIAHNFYFEHANIEGNIAYNDIEWGEMIPVLHQWTTVYYIFNINNDRGWVAVSADDRTIPVMCYALSGTYGSVPPPDNFIRWMSTYEQQILWAVENNIPQSPEVKALWEHYLAIPAGPKSTLAVAPLLGSIAWGQGCYYNAQCPINYMGECQRVPTGCVATAMAMVMKYHAYPTHGFNSHSYSHPTYGTLSANFGTATYGWASMPNSVNSSNTEVAEIMKHCGVSVDMDYDISGSGAYMSDAANAMSYYFIYNASYEYKGAYSDADWKAMIKADLDLGHPIMYAGSGDGGGHAFVLDGYQGVNNDYFHFNWGWEGYYNSYNYLDALYPGNNSNNGDFTDYQEAVMNIYPSPATTPAANFTASYTTITAPNFTTLFDQSTNEPLVWAWSVSPTAGTSYVGGTSSSSKNPKIAFTIPGQYSITLTATNSAGSDTETKSNFITVLSGVGIEESWLTSLQIFPNPASDHILIQSELGTLLEEMEIYLINACGAVVATDAPSITSSGSVQINISSIAEGLYYLKLVSGNDVILKKIAILR